MRGGAVLFFGTRKQQEAGEFCFQAESSKWTLNTISTPSALLITHIIFTSNHDGPTERRIARY